MNKADWLNDFSLLNKLFFLLKKRKVEKTHKSSLKKDIYKENIDIKENESETSYYGKKRRSYADYR